MRPAAHNGGSMPESGWELQVFVTDRGVEPFTRFIDELDEFRWAALDAALRTVLAVRGLDLVRTEWLKPLGQGLHEFRIRHDADEIKNMFGQSTATSTRAPRGSVLLRVFVHFHGRRVVLLLSGYDKGDDPKERRQQREIAEARRHLTEWRQQEARREAEERRRGGGPRRGS
jgi:putative component of toxin-antitoxin plasmid stabilization module